MAFIRAWADLVKQATGGAVSLPTDSTGTRQFYYAQPQDPKACVTWWDEPSGEEPDTDQPRTFDVRGIVRHPGTSAGRAIPGREVAQLIIDRLHGTGVRVLRDPITGEGYVLTQALALSAVPAPLGPDAEGNHEWSLVLRVTADTGQE